VAAAAAQPALAAAAAAGGEEDTGFFPKRPRRTFTELAKTDTITLPLVMQWLDPYSLLRSRRTCASWSAASRRAVAWIACQLSVNLEFVCSIPVRSVNQLRHLCLVRNLKAPLPPLRDVFQWLTQLPMLSDLRLEELELSTYLADLLATYLPSLRRLDVKMCIEAAEEIRQTKLQRLRCAMAKARAAGVPLDDEEEELEENGANEADEEEMEALAQAEEEEAAQVLPPNQPVASTDEGQAELGAESSAAVLPPLSADDARCAEGVLRGSPSELAHAAHVFFGHSHWPALETDDLHRPTLLLPALESLKLPNHSSLQHCLALMAHAPRLHTLHIRRSNSAASGRDTPASERAFVQLLNHLFATCYAHSLRALVLTHMHWHPMHVLDFEALQSLTHLSLSQGNTQRAVTVNTLRAVARLPSLQHFALCVSQMSVEVCAQAEWWQALSSIRALRSFTFAAHDQATLSDEDVSTIRSGLRALLSSPSCALESVHLTNCRLFDLDILLYLTRVVRTLRFLALVGFCSLSVASFTKLLKQLSLHELEIVDCPQLQTSAGLIALCAHAPELESLRFLVSNRPLALESSVVPSRDLGVSPEAWLHVAQLRRLRFLHLSGQGALSDAVVDAWCQQGIEGGLQQMALHQSTLRKFSGFEPLMPADATATYSKSTAVLSHLAPFSALSSSVPTAFSGVAWQEVRLSGWLLSHPQACKLLRSLPQLQLLSVHLLPSSVGVFVPPDRHQARLLFAGGDYASVIHANEHRNRRRAAARIS
jgi:hypothetical protein